MQKNSNQENNPEEPVENPRTLNKKEWNELLDALRAIAVREKEKQKRFQEEKKL